MNKLNPSSATAILSAIFVICSPHIAAAEAPQQNNVDKAQEEIQQPTAPDGISFVLSGGTGVVGRAGLGGGVQGALTMEQRGLGLGVFASAAGAAGAAGAAPDPEAEAPSDSASALVFGLGALATWQPVSIGIVPILGFGLGYGKTRTSHTQPLATFAEKGIVMSLQAGLTRAGSGSLFLLRAVVPAFKAQSNYGPPEDEYVMSVTAEYGFRFGG